jgi:hypothetical protein
MTFCVAMSYNETHQSCTRETLNMRRILENNLVLRLGRRVRATGFPTTEIVFIICRHIFSDLSCLTELNIHNKSPPFRCDLNLADQYLCKYNLIGS